MVVFFHDLMDPAYHPLLAALFSVIGGVALIPFLEATAHDRRSFPDPLRMLTAVGVLFQPACMGVIMPIYALFVITDIASVRPSTTPIPSLPSKINQGNTEALQFDRPTTLMLFLVRPFVTLAIFLHKVIRPPSCYVQSDHLTVAAALRDTNITS